MMSQSEQVVEFPETKSELNSCIAFRRRRMVGKRGAIPDWPIFIEMEKVRENLHGSNANIAGKKRSQVLPGREQ